MKRHLKLPVSFSRRDTGGEVHVVVDFGTAGIEEWCLNLVLLKEEMASSLTLTNGRDSLALRIGIKRDLDKSHRAIATWGGNGALELQLTLTELECWLSFFLKYFRDGIPDVDHIDLQVKATKSLPKGLFLTLKVAEAKPGVTPNEARRRLGLQ